MHIQFYLVKDSYLVDLLPRPLRLRFRIGGVVTDKIKNANCFKAADVSGLGRIWSILLLWKLREIIKGLNIPVQVERFPLF